MQEGLKWGYGVLLADKGGNTTCVIYRISRAKLEV